MTSPFDHVDEIDPTVIWTGVVGRAVTSERVTLAHIELEPGADVPEHQHENEQVGMLLAGSLRFRIGGEERDLVPGSTWCIPANVPHSVVVGPDGASLVEVFAPRRDDWADRERLGPTPTGRF